MKKFKANIGKITPFVKRYKASFIGAIIFIISAAIFNAIAPMTEGLVTTQLIKDSINIGKGIISGASVNFDYIIKVLGVLAIIYVSSTISTYIAGFLLTNAIQNTMRDLRNAIQDKIRKLPISYLIAILMEKY